MGLARQQFGSIRAECNTRVARADIWAGELRLHTVGSAEEARALIAFWRASGARCSEAIVTALQWVEKGLEGGHG